MTDLEREEFRQFNGRVILDLCALGKRVVEHYFPSATVCNERACPIVGLHNTDECAELIADAKAQGVRI